MTAKKFLESGKTIELKIDGNTLALMGATFLSAFGSREIVELMQNLNNCTELLENGGSMIK